MVTYVCQQMTSWTDDCTYLCLKAVEYSAACFKHRILSAHHQESKTLVLACRHLDASSSLLHDVLTGSHRFLFAKTIIVVISPLLCRHMENLAKIKGHLYYIKYWNQKLFYKTLRTVTPNTMKVISLAQWTLISCFHKLWNCFH